MTNIKIDQFIVFMADNNLGLNSDSAKSFPTIEAAELYLEGSKHGGFIYEMSYRTYVAPLTSTQIQEKYKL